MGGEKAQSVDRGSSRYAGFAAAGMARFPHPSFPATVWVMLSVFVQRHAWGVMTFPVYIHFFGHAIHSHVVLECLAYTAGFQTYLFLRRRNVGPRVPAEAAMWILVGCVTGALVGSKVLAWIESWPDYWQHRDDWRVWLGGKTIVGGLIGGWGGVEIAKKILGIHRRTGDIYVLPLCLGIAIGRVGCFLTGLDDHTHGIATDLPWAVNFGDGVRRHPTQLYEIAWLAILAIAFLLRLPRTRGIGDSSGRQFRLFIAGYMLFRFAVEFIKPSWKGYAGLSAIQLAAFLTTIVAVMTLRPRGKERVYDAATTT